MHRKYQCCFFDIGYWDIDNILKSITRLYINKRKQTWYMQGKKTLEVKAKNPQMSFMFYVFFFISDLIRCWGEDSLCFSRNQASESTELRVTGVYFLSLLSCNFDNQLSSKFHRFVILCISWDTPSEKTGLLQSPIKKVSSAFNARKLNSALLEITVFYSALA